MTVKPAKAAAIQMASGPNVNANLLEADKKEKFEILFWNRMGAEGGWLIIHFLETRQRLLGIIVG